MTWAFTVRSMPLDVAPMYRITGELTRDGLTWEVLRGPGDPNDPPPASFVGCEVKVSYRFNADERAALDESLVRKPFEGAKRLELEPIAVRNRAVRSPEVAAAQSLEEKVKAFFQQSGLPWTPGVERKLALLQLPDDGAFIQEVQKELSASRLPDGNGPFSAREAGEPPLTTGTEPAVHAAGRADADTFVAGGAL